MEGDGMEGARSEPARADAPERLRASGQHRGRSGTLYEGRFLELAVWDSPRRQLIALVEWAWFDRLVLLLIAANCALLAAQGPSPVASPLAAALSLFFQVSFTLEMAAKVGAMGIIASPSAYAWDGWNLLDAFVVVAGWIPYALPSASNVSALRSIRALRPLRSIKRLPGVKALVDTMVAAAPGLANVGVLCAFLFLIFGVLGMQLFKGAFRFHCHEPGDPQPVDTAAVCRPSDPGLFCESGQLCLPGSNPANGAVSFDRIDLAFLTIFQCITLEGWTDVMYSAMDALGWPACAYFVALVVCGAFFVLNLFLAVICDKFEHPDKPEAGKAEPPPRGPRASRQSPDSGSSAAALRGARARRLRGLLESAAVERFLVGVVCANTALLCAYYDGMPPSLAARLDRANDCLSLVFALELALKLAAYGLRVYAANPYNRLDALVVASSALEAGLELWPGAAAAGLNVSALRALRLFRVLKLARSLPGLARVLGMMLRALSELESLLILTSLLLLVFALLGEQLFGLRQRGDDGEGPPRTNFDSMAEALTTVFVVLSGENWNEVFQSCFAFAPLAASLYFVVLVVLGNFVLLNLIVAILLNSIDHTQDDEEDDEAEEHGRETQEEAGAIEEEAVPGPRSEGGGKASLAQLAPKALRKLSKIERQLAMRTVVDMASERAQEPAPDGFPCLAARHRDHALCCLPPTARLRVWAHAVVRHPLFEQFTLALVVVSSISVAVEPISDEQVAAASPAFLRGLAWADGACIIGFCAEALLKVLALGLLFPATAYLRDAFNVLDFSILLASLLSLLSPSTAFFKALRMARLLRPLRIASAHGGMRVIVECLLRTLPHVGSVLVVCALFLLVFGILGVQLFGGKLHSCSDPAVMRAEGCVGEWAPSGSGGPLEPRLWANPPFGSFDSLPAAALLLFEMSGLEGWPDVMYAGIDAVGVGVAPAARHNPAAAFYFIGWVAIGAFFVLNLFIGVVVDTFNTFKQHDEGALLMTPEQRQWAKALALVLTSPPLVRAERPPPGARAAAYDLVTHARFEVGVLGLVVLSTFAMAADSYDAPAWLTRTLTAADLGFVCAFSLEAALKLLAFGPSAYFASGWNRFDCALVLGSLADLAAESGALALDLPLSPMCLRALRLVRIGRMLRVVRAGGALRGLLRTLVQSLPSLSNVVVLLGLLLFVFAVVGMHLFHQCSGGAFLGRYAGFHSLPVALLTLFRCATGESWNGIMHDLMDGSGCARPGEAGCASLAAVPFFVAYTLSSTFVLLNIVIAVILDNFAASAEPDAGAPRVSDEHVDAFREAWARLDPTARQRIPLRALSELLLQTPLPLGLRGLSERRRHGCMRLIAELEVPVFALGSEIGVGLGLGLGEGRAAAGTTADAAGARGRGGSDGGKWGEREARSDRNDGALWVFYLDVLDALVSRAFHSAKQAAAAGGPPPLQLHASRQAVELRKSRTRSNLGLVAGAPGAEPSPQREGTQGVRSWDGAGLLAGQQYAALRLQHANARRMAAKAQRLEREAREAAALQAPAVMRPRTGASAVRVGGDGEALRAGAADGLPAEPGCLLVFGGLSAEGEPLADLWQLSSDGAWADLSASVPCALTPRQGHVASLLDGGRTLRISGGSGARGALTDAWECDLPTLRWRLLREGGAPQAGQRAAAPASRAASVAGRGAAAPMAML